MDHNAALESRLKDAIRDIPDWPKPGIMFRDITPLLADPASLRTIVDAMVTPYERARIDKIAVVESRGFLFGTPMAYVLDAGLVLIRKPNKLPYDTFAEPYSLEYGQSQLEIHVDAIRPGDRVVVVDDLLATGGTVNAAVNLVRRFEAEIVGISVLAELVALKGRDRFGEIPVHSLVRY